MVGHRIHNSHGWYVSPHQIRILIDQSGASHCRYVSQNKGIRIPKITIRMQNERYVSQFLEIRMPLFRDTYPLVLGYVFINDGIRISSSWYVSDRFEIRIVKLVKVLYSSCPITKRLSNMLCTVRSERTLSQSCWISAACSCSVNSVKLLWQADMTAQLGTTPLT